MRPWILPLTFVCATAGAYWLGLQHVGDKVDAERQALSAERASLADQRRRESSRSSASRAAREGGESAGSEDTALETQGARRRGQLSNERIQELLPEVLAEGDPIERSRRLAEMFDSITPENMSLYINALQDSPGVYRENERRLLYFALGKVDGPQAMTLLAQDGDERKFRDLGNTVLSGWASQNPEQAAKWRDSISDERTRGDFINGLVDGWVKKDLNAATAYIASLPEGRDRNRAADNLARAHSMQGGVEAAVAWANSLPAGSEKDEFRKFAFEAAFREGVGTRPEETLKLLSNNMSSPYAADLYRDLIGRAAESNPAVARQFAENQSDPEIRGRSFESVAERLARRDPNATGTWLNQYPEDPALDRARRSFARQVFDQNPEAALAWTSAIKTPAVRERAAVDMARDWLRKEPEKARAWVQASNLSDAAKKSFLPPPAKK